MIFNILRKLIWRPLVPILEQKLFPDKEFIRLSFSQEGEDVVLKSIFEEVPPICKFYVDLGAYHPKRYSNTYLFYKQGWRGINIDAMPGSMDLFNEERPDDTNIEAAIAPDRRMLMYHMYEKGGLNTLSSNLVSERQGDSSCQITGEEELHTKTLNEVLKDNIQPGQEIGFMDVDVEGLDLDILKSLDFSRYAPHYLMVEDKGIARREDSEESEIAKFLNSLEYYLVGKTYRTAIYRTDTFSNRASV